MKLSIVIPVYNERLWITALWSRLKSAPIERCEGVSEVELVVVDDGSTDGTAEHLARLAREPFQFHCGLTASLHLIRQAQNGGKGSAVRTGIEHSTGDIVLIQDADLEYSPEDYPTLLEPITRNLADAVFGSRFIGPVHRVLYFWHSVMNRLLTLLSNAFNDVNLTDMETGFKVIRGDVARNLRLTCERFGIEPELTARLAHAGVRIFEVPIRYHGRTYTQGKRIRARDGIAALYFIFKFGLWDRVAYQPGPLATRLALEKEALKLHLPMLKKALAAKNKGSLRILEIGAGPGILTEILLQHGDVVATAETPSEVRDLRSRHGIHESFEAREWIPSQDPWEGAGYFDLIVALNASEHARKTGLRPWSRMLGEKGTLLVLSPHRPPEEETLTPVQALPGGGWLLQRI